MSMEYSLEVWDPHLIKNIWKLEDVQKRSVRFICQMRDVESVTTGKQMLEFDPFQERCKNE